MSNKAINFIITARDRASAIFSRVTGAVRRFAGGILRTMTSLPALIGGSALVAGVSKLVGAFMHGERQTRRLAAALAQAGGAGEGTLRRFAALAGEMQKVTNVDEELTKSAMALGLNLGVPLERLEEVTKAALGLSAATGMDLRTAMQLFGREASGATAALSRYGIVIEEGLSQQERLNRLVQIGNDRFKQVAVTTKGTAGAWDGLKNALGDLWKMLGSGIDQAFNLEAVFNRIRQAIENIDGERIAKGLSATWNLVRSLFNGTVKWIDVLRGAGKVVGLSLKVGLTEALDFLYKSFRGIVTGLTHALGALPEYLGALFRAYTTPSYWSGVAKVIAGSLGVLGNHLMRIFTAPIAALGAGLDKVWLEFSNRMAGTRVGRWAGFEKQEDQSFGELYAEHRRMGDEFTTASMEGSRQLVREGYEQVKGHYAELGNIALDGGKRFASGFASEMAGNGLFDTSGDRAKIAGIMGDARSGLSDLFKPSLLRDAFSDASRDAQGLLGPGSSALSDLRRQLEGGLELKIGRADLGDVFDAGRGQDHAVQKQMADSLHRLVSLNQELLNETKQGGIS